MDPLTALILEAAKGFGIPPVTVALAIPLIITAANRIARIIPDTATGWKKYVRIACSIIGAHVKDNSGVPAVVDGAGAVIRRALPEQIPEDAQGVLLLDSTMKIDMFKRANEAINDRQELN